VVGSVVNKNLKQQKRHMARKQKTPRTSKKHLSSASAKWSPLRFAGHLGKKPLLAGLAVALAGIPASWMMVNAQSPDDVQRPTDSGEYNQNGTKTGRGTNGRTGAGDVSKTDPAKKATDKNTDPAAATDKQTTGTSSGNPGGAPAGGGSSAGQGAGTGNPAPPVTPPAGLHENITVTIFWVGEPAGPDNANISNAESAWDGNWQTHYDGFDDPDHRNGYYPAGFTPSENPFYFALPYNDLDDNGDRKPTANNCPNVGASVSWCKNAWIKITKGSKTVYAQWEDVGPLKEDDVAYVFGTAAPANRWGAKAGLDVSPAVRDYLGLADVDKVSWTFVSAAEVPSGPWKQIVTTSAGGW
jgi:hypothetical protein